MSTEPNHTNTAPDLAALESELNALRAQASTPNARDNILSANLAGSERELAAIDERIADFERKAREHDATYPGLEARRTMAGHRRVSIDTPLRIAREDRDRIVAERDRWQRAVDEREASAPVANPRIAALHQAVEAARHGTHSEIRTDLAAAQARVVEMNRAADTARTALILAERTAVDVEVRIACGDGALEEAEQAHLAISQCKARLTAAEKVAAAAAVHVDQIAQRLRRAEHQDAVAAAARADADLDTSRAALRAAESVLRDARSAYAAAEQRQRQATARANKLAGE